MERFQELQQAFENQANPQQATKMAAYLKNQFAFYGLPAPQRRLIYKPLIAADKKDKLIDWELLDLAWQNPYRELDYLVCDYLRARSKELTYEDISRLMPYLTSKQWWDSIDSLAPIFGTMAKEDSRIEKLMLAWAQDEDIWLRRSAIIHQLGRKDSLNISLLEEILKANLGRSEFFINKAMGWALRDYARTNPNWVRDFLNRYQSDLSPLTLREAGKYLSN